MTQARFIIGDTRQVLRTLPDASVDLVLTSPPFLALRSYLPADHPDKALEMGSEPTPGEFIDGLLDVVEECRRVLAPHGSIAFELGDTYSGSGGAGGDYNTGGLREGQEAFHGSAKHGRLASYSDSRGNPDGMRDTTFQGANTRSGGGQGWPEAKSLCLIPEIFRFSLVYGFNPLTGRQTPRWRARNVVRWTRPNPPVGALGDKFRPATSDLVIATMAKDRYFDLDAVRGPVSGNTHARAPKGVQSLERTGKSAERGGNWSTLAELAETGGAPPLDWWKISTQPYAGSHYATWPEELCVIPIKAMVPQRVCTTCGQPSRRIVGHTAEYATFRAGKLAKIASGANTTRDKALRPTGFTNAGTTMSAECITLGWTDCAHGSWRTGVVLDPFAGSGTTLAVATGHGRDAIGIDLDERNADLAMERVGPMLLTVENARAEDGAA